MKKVLLTENEYRKVISILNEKEKIVIPYYENAKKLCKELGYSVKKIACAGKNLNGYDHFQPDSMVEINGDDGKELYVIYENEKSAYDSAVNDLENTFMDNDAILGEAINHYGIYCFLEYVSCDADKDGDIADLFDELGNEEFGRYVHNRLQSQFNVNYEKFAKHNIDDLGIAWHLAQYDGEEIEFGDGMLAYRVE